MVSNENSYTLQKLIMSPPTYLKEFSVDGQVQLVFDKRPSNSEETEDIKPFIKNDNTSTEDLTGDPLKVDLSGDETFDRYVKCEIPNHWTFEEEKYFPLSLRTARQFINSHNMIRKSIEAEDEKPIYAVCDGRDTLCTVIIGAHKFGRSLMTTLINILGYYPKDYNGISLDNMEKDHVKNVRVVNPKIIKLMKFKYYLYGFFLQNIKNIRNTEIHGSICIKVSCTNSIMNIPQNVSSMELVLQIISGHQLSSVYFLWEELSILQTYLDILSDNKIYHEETPVISTTPLPESDIHENINILISTNSISSEVKLPFDLKHVRRENIMDKLWNILKCCEDLSVLRDSLQYFFEELVETEANIEVPDSDKSSIGILIHGIINGKLAVPTLTFFQALEFLFILGAEKLKNDYQAIIKHVYPSSDQELSVMWNKLQKEDISKNNRRKTRITLSRKTGITDLSTNMVKLAHLGKLHVATELIYLIKDQVNLPEDTMDYVCEKVYTNYVAKNAAPHDFSDLQMSPICQFEIILKSADTKIIENQSPVSWSIQMTSKVNDLEVVTMYHLSEYPIFPTSVFNNYGIPDETKEHYYVSKLVRYTEEI